MPNRFFSISSSILLQRCKLSLSSVINHCLLGISRHFLAGIFSQMNAVGMPSGAKYECLLFGKVDYLVLFWCISAVWIKI